jgi:CubicO group peptidase (beta-lactamase class C family)
MWSERENGVLAARVGAVLNAAVEQRRIVGGVVRVARDGLLVADRVAGLADREMGLPMQRDTVFRLASLTKPVVSAATLGLIERGVLDLESPITRWLPDFRPTFEGRPARITVRHLMTHTSGLGYALLEPRSGAYHAAGISDGLDQPGFSLEENLRRLGSQPLLFEPGTAFLYSLSHDVLGGVIERATGEPLPEVIARAITGPLEMRDTAFTWKGRPLAVPYTDGRPEPVRMEDGTYLPFGESGITFAPSRALDPGAYPSGGAGMVGTAGDYLRFLEAIRTRSGIAPARWLDAMTRDQIAPLTSPILGDGWGWGFGASVLRDPQAAQSPMRAGSVRWGGVYGHSWWIDPQSKLSAVLLTNTAVEGMNGALRTEIQRAVYGA